MTTSKITPNLTPFPSMVGRTIKSSWNFSSKEYKVLAQKGDIVLVRCEEGWYSTASLDRGMAVEGYYLPSDEYFYGGGYSAFMKALRGFRIRTINTLP